jgi:SAM-dependent methyltransferase
LLRTTAAQRKNGERGVSTIEGRRAYNVNDRMTSDALRTAAACHRPAPTAKNKACLLGVMKHCLGACEIDKSEPVLVLGGGHEDMEILSACGFKNVVMSNLDAEGLSLDAEELALPDNSYPLVFAHAVLHHCRSPHKALGEMIRVSQRHVCFLEPNDSWVLRLLVRLGISFPYELAAVADNGYTRGGMRYGPVPNYIYRWTQREVQKCVSSYVPERECRVLAHAYWDFYVNEFDVLGRRESRQPSLARKLGPGNFISLLHAGQAILSLIPGLRSQGNKFFCVVKKAELQPWIETRDGQYRLKTQETQTTP